MVVTVGVFVGVVVGNGVTEPHEVRVLVYALDPLEI